MAADSGGEQRFEVLIAGGGVAALEGALALRELAGGRVTVRVMAPSAEFVYRPLTVQEPFAYARAQRYPLDEIAQDIGAELIVDALSGVDPGRRTVRTESGSEVGYDALLLGLGARLRARYEHAITIDDRQLDEQLHGLVQDVEDGLVKRLAFVMPPQMAWPLPIYELALLTATRAYDMNVELAITLLTPEDAPLALFGTGVSERIGELLSANRIEVVASSYCEIPRAGEVEISPGERRREFDRIVALPELDGPAVEGLPSSDGGFIAIDERCQVRGVDRVYAAGDATDFAVKQGGIASQQADVAAQSIAALAGAPVAPVQFDPEVRAILLTGGEPLYMRAHLTGGHGFSSEVSTEPPAQATGKIAARWLAPYLEARDRAAR